MRCFIHSYLQRAPFLLLLLLLLLLQLTLHSTQGLETKKPRPRGWKPLEAKTLEKDPSGSNLDENSYDDGRVIQTKNTYLVTAPHLVRPESVYRVEVNLLKGEEPLEVQASLITSTSSQLSQGRTRISPGESKPILLQTPENLGNGNLTLSVRGYNGNKALVFSNATHVASTSKFLTILVEMARSVFNFRQRVNFRVVLLKADNLPYEEPVNVFIHDSNGIIVKRWVSVTPNSGVLSLFFDTPGGVVNGWWRVRVLARSQEEEHPFYMKRYHMPYVEVAVHMPITHQAEDEVISGQVRAFFTNDKPAKGNATLDLLLKKNWKNSKRKEPKIDPMKMWRGTFKNDGYIKVDSKTFYFVDEKVNFSFPMTSLGMDDPTGSEVRVMATFHEANSAIKAKGYSATRIIKNQLSLRFVNNGKIVFKPGMVFKSTVFVTYDDLEPLEPARLETGSLSIAASVTLRAGQVKNLPEIHIPTKKKHQETTLTYLEWWRSRERKKHLFEDDLSHSTARDIDPLKDDLESRNLEDFLYRIHVEEKDHAEFRKTGIFSFSLDIPEDATSLTLTAAFKDDLDAVSVVLKGEPKHTPSRRFLQVTSSTEDATIGQFVVFHVRSNFAMDKFHYLIIAKGLLFHSATEELRWVTGGVATLPVVVASAMAPRFTFLVYHVPPDGEVVADALAVPVASIGRTEASVVVNQHKDHSKKTVEVSLRAEAGSFFGLSCHRSANALHRVSGLTQARVTAALHQMEPSPRSVHKIELKSRNGTFRNQLLSLHAESYARDSLQTFQQAGLVVLTDASIHIEAFSGHCDWATGFLECGDGSCHRREEICDGVPQCHNGADELGCKQRLKSSSLPEHVTRAISEKEAFQILRRSPWKHLYDVKIKNWCWSDKFIGHRGIEELVLSVPRTKDDWLVSGFAIHPEFGLALVPTESKYQTHPPFFMILQAPGVCRRGEQISIRAVLFNTLDQDIQAMVVLPESENYKFVHVEEGGAVSNFYPRTSSGEHHHLVFIPAGGYSEELLPLAVVKQSGRMTVTVRGITQAGSDEDSVTIRIKPEGVLVRKHTSLIIDLKNRATVYEFFDIPIDESPIIPNQLQRRYIYGSPQASFSLSGDVFGPTTKSISLSYKRAFNGRYFKNIYGNGYNMGATLWSLHYLRLTGQLDQKKAAKAFDYVTVELSAVLRRYKKGPLSMWHRSKPSVWATAHMLRIYLLAMFEEWENYLYIDQRLVDESVEFLVRHQRVDGSFVETKWTNVTFDQKLNFKPLSSGSHASIGLTALTAMVLHGSIKTLQGPLKSEAIRARHKAVQFLEMNLKSLWNPYDIAITAYVLTLTMSLEKDAAISQLESHRRSLYGMYYWSPVEIAANRRKYENNQRNFILPKEPQEWDSMAVEATSYALLVFLVRDGVTLENERIVTWLQSVRDWNLAFTSPADSLVAMQALTEYAYRARLRDITSMNIRLEAASTKGFMRDVSISNVSLSSHRFIEIPNAWGHVYLKATGFGQALAQMELSYGVDVPYFMKKPSRKFFDLTVKEFYHSFGNKSLITITVCTRWAAVDLSPTSHAATIEVEMPTGYKVYQPYANSVVRKGRFGSFPQMIDSKPTDEFMFWELEYIPSTSTQCFSYRLERWFPAANHTAVRSATVFESMALERFETVMINTTPLAALDICEVCGSYQCPYCPYYSGRASKTRPYLVALWGLTFFFVLIR
ncbi:CD109 antigen-like [Oratosquilla oratoria]|uniref:CD109 antigen-like n=1 Tax=Oratosquilla oratoria TaxID=337810 RepID=UPI003F757A08